MTTAGELRERVAFDRQFQVDTSPSYGLTVGDWEQQFTAAAKIKALVGTEPVIGQRLTGIQPYVITVRRSSNTQQIDASWRVRDVRTGVQYQIRSVTPDQKREFIDLLAERSVAVG